MGWNNKSDEPPGNSPTDSLKMNMKTRIVLSTLWLMLSAAISPVLRGQSSSEIRQYISTHKDIALEQERIYGIPAAITLAQAILESGAGSGYLAVNANNHFGIKAYGGWKGDVHYAWDDERHKSRFRKYNSAAASFRDYAAFLSENPRYSSIFKYSVFDYRAWASGLQKAGYATAPNYARELIYIIEAYELYALNGGIRIKPKETVTITQYKTETVPVIEEIVVEEEVYEEFTSSSFEEVIEINGVWCTTITSSRNINAISEENHIPVYKLMEYNDLTNEYDIKEGDIIFLKAKKKKYLGGLDYYTVKEGESIHSISQRFGIRLHSLMKMNQLTIYDTLKEGSTLRLK